MIDGFREKLPTRFLTVDELEAIDEAAPSAVSVSAGSVLRGGEQLVVPVVHIVDRDREVMVYLGFDPRADRWAEIGSWTPASYSKEEIETAVSKWGRETFGEERVKHSVVDVEED